MINENIFYFIDKIFNISWQWVFIFFFIIFRKEIINLFKLFEETIKRINKLGALELSEISKDTTKEIVQNEDEINKIYNDEIDLGLSHQSIFIKYCIEFESLVRKFAKKHYINGPNLSSILKELLNKNLIGNSIYIGFSDIKQIRNSIVLGKFENNIDLTNYIKTVILIKNTLERNLK